jgi:hypothetical protein
MHIGSDRELATEIVAAQYVRPAHTFRKLRFYRSSHVEVMHEDSWWPGVILNFLGSGTNKKYIVKLKSYETDMEDVECLDVLTVENTHLRPKYHWNGKKWIHCLEQVHVTSTYISRHSLRVFFFMRGYEVLFSFYVICIIS